MQLGVHTLPRYPIGQLRANDKTINKHLTLGARFRRPLLYSRLVPSSLENSDDAPPSPEEEPAPVVEPTVEGHENKDDVQPLGSWADEEPQPSTTDDWGLVEDPRHPIPKHPLGNAIFSLALGGLAVGTVLIGQKFHAYNKYRTAQLHQMAATVAQTATPHGIIPPPPRQKLSPPSSAEEYTPPSFELTPPSAAAEENCGAIADTFVDQSEKKKKKLHDDTSTLLDKDMETDNKQPSSISSTAAADSDGNSLLEKKEDSFHRLPSADGEHRSSFQDLHEDSPSPSRPSSETPEVLPLAQVASDNELLGQREERPVLVPETSIHSSTIEETSSSLPERAPSGAVFPPAQGREAQRSAMDQSGVDKTEDTSKLPLRSAEGAAALERIRAVQERRRHLYDRAIARQDQRYNEQQQANDDARTFSGTADLPGKFRFSAPFSKTGRTERITREGPVVPPTPQPSAQLKERIQDQAEEERTSFHRAISEIESPLDEGKGRKSEESSSTQTEDLPYKSWLVSEAAKYADEAYDEPAAEPAVLPVGMTLQALRERASTANKAAAGAVAAAHRAATASALAADASNRAAHAAQQAALAAARTQSALESRSVDAIEDAYRAATEAQEAAEVAAKEAAVGYAKAVVGEHDTSKHGDVAIKAGDLSRPRGIVAQTSEVLHQLRRNTVTAVEKAREGVVAGKEAVVEAVGTSTVVGQAMVDGLKGAWNAFEERIKAIGK